LGPHIKKVQDAPKPLTDQTADEQQNLCFEQHEAVLELLAAKTKKEKEDCRELGTQP